MTTAPGGRAAFLLVLGALAACGGDEGKGKPDGGTTPTDSGSAGDDDDTTGSTGTTGPDDLEVFVNEIVTQNATGLQDASGAFPDWVELYNAGSAAVDLEGFWLSDDATFPFKFQFPAGTSIGAGDFLLIYCDSDPSTGGELHAPFNLGGLDTEDVALFGLNVDNNPLIDAIEDLAIVPPDTSFARMPDGGPTVDQDPTPTPGAPNE